MLCYRCNGTLDLGRDTCSKCGTDIRIYKKIVYASNRYYNEGLLKAQARDLTGARDALRKSLHLYKKNTNARNLLGLVDYAMGESAEALKEWVVSKNLSSSRNQNIADRFINNMKRNMRELDSEGHGIKKYNQALSYAKSGAKDLAVIQLKKVVSVHKNMTKAYELLALLYIDDGKYEQAHKVLTQCLQVDRGNASALHYLKELESMDSKNNGRSIGTVGEDDREQVIIPVRFRDYGTYLSNAFFIIFGLLLGVLIAWFVIVPGKVEKEMEGGESQANSYEARISDLQADYYRMSKEAEEAKVTTTEKAADATTKPTTRDADHLGESDSETEPTEEPPEEAFFTRDKMVDRWSKNQSTVVDGVNQFIGEQFADMVHTIFKINPELLNEENAEHYRDLIIILTDYGVYNRTMEQAASLRADGDPKEAGRTYDSASMMQPPEYEPLYLAAQCYEEAGEPLTAANRYWQVYYLYPDFEGASACGQKYMELTGKDYIPDVPEGTDLEALRKELDRDAFLDAIVEN